MNDHKGYAVFFFPQALEALGEAINPYLQDGPAGPHVACYEIDTGGTLVEMTLRGSASEGRAVTLELMVPSAMVRMIVSTHSDETFGFAPHVFEKPAPVLPSEGSGAQDAEAPSTAVPQTAKTPDAKPDL